MGKSLKRTKAHSCQSRSSENVPKSTGKLSKANADLNQEENASGGCNEQNHPSAYSKAGPGTRVVATAGNVKASTPPMPASVVPSNDNHNTVSAVSSSNSSLSKPTNFKSSSLDASGIEFQGDKAPGSNYNAKVVLDDQSKPGKVSSGEEGIDVSNKLSVSTSNFDELKESGSIVDSLTIDEAQSGKPSSDDGVSVAESMIHTHETDETASANELPSQMQDRKIDPADSSYSRSTASSVVKPEVSASYNTENEARTSLHLKEGVEGYSNSTSIPAKSVTQNNEKTSLFAQSFAIFKEYEALNGTKSSSSSDTPESQANNPNNVDIPSLQALLRTSFRQGTHLLTHEAATAETKCFDEQNEEVSENGCQNQLGKNKSFVENYSVVLEHDLNMDQISALDHAFIKPILEAGVATTPEQPVAAGTTEPSSDFTSSKDALAEVGGHDTREKPGNIQLNDSISVQSVFFFPDRFCNDFDKACVSPSEASSSLEFAEAKDITHHPLNSSSSNNLPEFYRRNKNTGSPLDDCSPEVKQPVPHLDNQATSNSSNDGFLRKEAVGGVPADLESISASISSLPQDGCDMRGDLQGTSRGLPDSILEDVCLVEAPSELHSFGNDSTILNASGEGATHKKASEDPSNESLLEEIAPVGSIELGDILIHDDSVTSSWENVNTPGGVADVKASSDAIDVILEISSDRNIFKTSHGMNDVHNSPDAQASQDGDTIPYCAYNEEEKYENAYLNDVMKKEKEAKKIVEKCGNPMVCSVAGVGAEQNDEATSYVNCEQKTAFSIQQKNAHINVAEYIRDSVRVSIAANEQAHSHQVKDPVNHVDLSSSCSGSRCSAELPPSAFVHSSSTAAENTSSASVLYASSELYPSVAVDSSTHSLPLGDDAPEWSSGQFFVRKNGKMRSSEKPKSEAIHDIVLNEEKPRESQTTSGDQLSPSQIYVHSDTPVCTNVEGVNTAKNPTPEDDLSRNPDKMTWQLRNCSTTGGSAEMNQLAGPEGQALEVSAASEAEHYQPTTIEAPSSQVAFDTAKAPAAEEAGDDENECTLEANSAAEKSDTLSGAACNAAGSLAPLLPATEGSSHLLGVPLMAEFVTVFSLSGCHNCSKAKMLLKKAHINFKEIDLEIFPEKRADMFSIANSLVVPQIFINNYHLGGLSELEFMAGFNLLRDFYNKIVLERDCSYKSLPGSPRVLLERTHAEEKAKIEDSAFSQENPGELDPRLSVPVMKPSPRANNLRPRNRSSPSSVDSKEAAFNVFLLLVKNLNPRKIKKGLFKSYDNCFYASEAVTCLSSAMCTTREEAVNKLSKLSDRYLWLVEQSNADEFLVNTGAKFLDSRDIYQLQYNIDTRVLNKARLSSGFTSHCGVVTDPVGFSKELLRSLFQLENAHIDSATGLVDLISLEKDDGFVRFQLNTQRLCMVSLKSLNHSEKIAFLINCYNLLTRHACVRGGIPYNNSISRHSFYSCFAYTIGNHVYTLEDIEHGLLRMNARRSQLGMFTQFAESDPRSSLVVSQFDYRIHFALNCGAVSCPPVSIYSAQSLERQLEIAAIAFCESPSNMRVSDEDSTIYLSRIFLWHAADFGAQKDILDILIKHTKGKKYEQLLKLLEIEPKKLKFVYLPYDWKVPAKSTKFYGKKYFGIV